MNFILGDFCWKALCVNALQSWGPNNHGGIDFGNGGPAALRHGDLNLLAEDVQYANDALLATQGKSPKEWPADKNRLGSHGQSFHYVCTAPDSAIEQNFCLAFSRLHGFG